MSLLCIAWNKHSNLCAALNLSLGCLRSDGSNFIGFTTYDNTNFNMFSPCVGMEATSGLSQSAIKTFSATNPIPNDKFYPEQFNFTLKLDKPCRSFCLTAHDGGFNKTVKYSKRRMVSQGLTLEVYKSEKGERVGIKYIKISIMKTSGL